jgi:predicted outer membrane repeat protein
VIDSGDAGIGSRFQGDLRYCLEQANVNSEPSNSIVFDPNLAGTITLTQGPLVISKAVEIDGPGQDVVTISGNHQSGVFNITSDARAQVVAISGLTIADGTGVIVGDQDVGGGIYNDHAELTLSHCTVTGNSAVSTPFGRGGGIYLTGGTLTLDSCTVSGNASGGSGGGIYNSGGTLIVNDSSVSGNTSGESGGAIYSRQFLPFPDDTTFVLNSSLIADNHAGNGFPDVGGLDIGDAATITDSTISGNTGYWAGGVFLIGTLARQTISTISGCAIVGNTSSTLGAGLVNDGDSLTVTSTIVSGNGRTGGIYDSATGGIYNGGAGRLTLVDSVVSDNDGGGISNYAQLTISGSTISGNTHGSGLRTVFGRTEIVNSTFSGNSAVQGGGIFVNPGAFAELTSVTITGNTATGTGALDYGGGGLSVLSTYGNGRAVLHNTLVAGNFSAKLGPDAYGSVLSLGYNLVGAADDSQGWEGHDVTGTSSSPIDPMLGPLQDNGGPTPTHALHVGSPAINRGDPALADSLDQRGSVRFHTGAPPPVDIGAFDANFLQRFRLVAPSEVVAGEPFTITVTALDFSGNTASTFVGRVHFSSTDSEAVLPDDYTFTAADAGTATFTVTLQTEGSQQLEVIALDPPGGFRGSATVIVDPAGDGNGPLGWESPVVNQQPALAIALDLFVDDGSMVFPTCESSHHLQSTYFRPISLRRPALALVNSDSGTVRSEPVVFSFLDTRVRHNSGSIFSAQANGQCLPPSFLRYRFL